MRGEDGLDKLIAFLDEKLGKDDLTSSLEKFEDFENFQREPGQNMEDFIAKFDQKYRRLAKFEMGLPHTILAFKLLRKANISRNEKMLVLTGMNYAEKNKLYDQAKASLLKFKGEQGAGCGGLTPSATASVKLETFLANDLAEDALISAGYVRSSYIPNKPIGSWRGNPRGNPHGTWRGNQRGTSRGKPTRKVNANGSDGRPMLCNACGSYRHLVHDCPDSWENMERVNIVDTKSDMSDIQQVTLLTGYHKDTLKQLEKEAQRSAVLDSGCTSTVCGENWLKNYTASLSEENQAKIVAKPGVKRFKFDGGENLRSLGSYLIPATIAGSNVNITTG